MQNITITLGNKIRQKYPNLSFKDAFKKCIEDSKEYNKNTEKEKMEKSLHNMIQNFTHMQVSINGTPLHLQNDDIVGINGDYTRLSLHTKNRINFSAENIIIFTFNERTVSIKCKMVDSFGDSYELETLYDDGGVVYFL